jgi:hypothetical protein
MIALKNMPWDIIVFSSELANKLANGKKSRFYRSNEVSERGGTVPKDSEIFVTNNCGAWRLFLKTKVFVIDR